MKNIFIGDVFERDLDLFFKQKGKFNFSGTEYNLNVTKALKFDRIISCPSISHFPITSKTFYFSKPKTNSKIHFVKYCNLIGYNAISAKNSINREFDKLKLRKDEQINIFLSELKYQFLASSLKIKNKYPNSKIFAIVMDVPTFIGESKKSWIYKKLKSIGNKKALKMTKEVDGFLFLSEKMNFLNTQNVPYKVFPFVLDDSWLIYDKVKNITSPVISYCGVISKQFNFDLFLKAIPLIKGENVNFKIAGDGDCKNEIIELEKIDKRVKYFGLVSREKAKTIQEESSILVNPRLPSYYTDYSFPSKIPQFLSTGKTVVSYIYGSIPMELSKEIVAPTSNTPEGFADAINHVLETKEYLTLKDRNAILSNYNIKHLSKCLQDLIKEVRK